MGLLMLTCILYNKQNNCKIKKKVEIWLESMKLTVSESQSVSQIRSKMQPIAMRYGNNLS